MATIENRHKDTNEFLKKVQPLVLTQEATELDVALDELQKVCKRLCDQLDDLTANIKKLTEENERLKDALGIVESSPIEDLEKTLNEK
jgi:cell shape-determining protein MreC|tara:strand:- start:348 stop:611 length:264 start_codon:yes stop_codon:yes gene_type:complete